MAADWALAVLLLSARIGTVFLITPVPFGQAAPVVVRVMTTTGLSALLIVGMDVELAPILQGTGSIVLSMLSEAIAGAVLAFGILAAFASFHLAGKVLDVQIGFGIANVLDPITRAQTPMLANALNLLAVAVFFGMDGHHALIRGMAYSLNQVPLGAWHAWSANAAVRQFGLMFSLGLVVVIPVFSCLFLVEIGNAILSRVLPQMNALVLIVPVKIVVGLAVLAQMLPTMGPVMRKVYQSIFLFWEEVLD